MLVTTHGCGHAFCYMRDTRRMSQSPVIRMNLSLLYPRSLLYSSSDGPGCSRSVQYESEAYLSHNSALNTPDIKTDDCEEQQLHTTSPPWLQRSTLLVGESGVTILQGTRVLLVGLGGVGSFVAEFLVRAGIGSLTVVDGDVVDLTNKNRQLPALDSTVGSSKAKVVSSRLLDINPELDLTVIEDFIDPEKARLLVQYGSTEAPASREELEECSEDQQQLQLHDTQQAASGLIPADDSNRCCSHEVALSTGVSESCFGDKPVNKSSNSTGAGSCDNDHIGTSQQGGQRVESSRGSFSNASSRPPFDYVVDCIDSIAPKLSLLVAAHKAGIKVVSSMGAGGRLDPGRIRMVDVFNTHNDPFAANIRQGLRKAGIKDSTYSTSMLPKPSSTSSSSGTSALPRTSSTSSASGTSVLPRTSSTSSSSGTSALPRPSSTSSSSGTSVLPRTSSTSSSSGTSVLPRPSSTSSSSGAQRHNHNNSNSNNRISPKNSHSKAVGTAGTSPGIVVAWSDEPVTRASLALTDQRYKKSYYGTISYIPAAFGLHMASYIIRELLGTPASQLLDSTPEAVMRKPKNRDSKLRSSASISTRSSTGKHIEEYSSNKTQGYHEQKKQKNRLLAVPTGDDAAVEVQDDQRAGLAAGHLQRIGSADSDLSRCFKSVQPEAATAGLVRKQAATAEFCSRLSPAAVEELFVDSLQPSTGEHPDQPTPNILNTPFTTLLDAVFSGTGDEGQGI
ncbi:hypothetical protein CEUSTIGMA_g2614.t1 [Chlamydomonas eustigma]|uniref:THIF-type NAD/FAD binding fold domain-containing protein n=1 Tax=Chlamydomonas eustigma TaxID=1157962 RepID=A0A250WXB7_9CHLO|nr:hypothetical protein CEUSTIGMA_g2614.t1 [Chlamydomonas eustigma]|eukprot:GAX75170.1 hypothetical protein CEUSTIGMA_g2614.t1 [Chlamydomonas eustigma]